MKFILYAITFLLTLFAVASAKKCKALAMSGAGTKGAYQAAVVKGFANLLPIEEIDYDVVVGVSAGSLNAFQMAAYDKFNLHSAGDEMIKYWNESVSGGQMPDWPGGIYEGLFYQSGLHPNDPSIAKMKEKWANKTVNRKVSISTVDSVTAKYEVFDYNATGTLPDIFIETVYASASIPFIYTNRHIGNKVLIDGGWIWNVNIDSAIRRCKEIVDDESDIIVDIIHVGHDQIKNVESFEGYKALDHLMRSLEIKDFWKDGMNNFNTSMLAHPEVDFRYIISPSEDLSTGGIVSLDFNQEFIQKCFDVGFKDAQTAVSNKIQNARDSIDSVLSFDIKQEELISS